MELNPFNQSFILNKITRGLAIVCWHFLSFHLLRLFVSMLLSALRFLDSRAGVSRTDSVYAAKITPDTCSNLKHHRVLVIPFT